MDELEQIEREIAEEREKAEQAKIPVPQVSRAPVIFARFAWIAGVIGVDAYTAWIWLIYTTWFYAVVWFAVASVGLIYWDIADNRPGNNQKQSAKAKEARVVSAVAVILMAFVAGAINLLGLRSPYISVGIEIASLALAGYHLFSWYTYDAVDDERVARNDEARAEADSDREVRAAHRAGRRVAAKLGRIRIDNVYRQKYGKAYDAARGIPAEGNNGNVPRQQRPSANPTQSSPDK